MTWKIGLTAWSLLLTILIGFGHTAPAGVTREFARVACYIALANDLAPLFQSDAPEPTTSRQCDEERIDGRSEEGPAVLDVAPTAAIMRLGFCASASCVDRFG